VTINVECNNDCGNTDADTDADVCDYDNGNNNE
jgi:hypothetical protein